LSTIADKTAISAGRAVKAKREAMGLTLRALAARSGISSSMISDIERGTKSPTVSTLAMLADALGVAISALLDAETEPPARIRLVRASEHAAVIDHPSGARRQSFGPSPFGSRVEFLRYVVPPHAIAGPFPAHASGTIEHAHVASGQVRIVFGEEAVQVEAGDSCSCRADAPHLFDNQEGDAEAVIYLVIERG